MLHSSLLSLCREIKVNLDLLPGDKRSLPAHHTAGYQTQIVIRPRPSTPVLRGRFVAMLLDTCIFKSYSFREKEKKAQRDDYLIGESINEFRFDT